jgi:Leucine-rich repeat (LRR) protein
MCALCCITVCPNITDLDLTSNSITDASALAELQHLEKLRLTDNAIESLSFAAELPRLTQLLVQGNRLGHMKEIAHLAQLKNLRTLYLRNIDGSSPNPRTHCPEDRTIVTLWCCRESCFAA